MSQDPSAPVSDALEALRLVQKDLGVDAGVEEPPPSWGNERLLKAELNKVRACEEELRLVHASHLASNMAKSVLRDSGDDASLPPHALKLKRDLQRCEFQLKALSVTTHPLTNEVLRLHDIDYTEFIDIASTEATALRSTRLASDPAQQHLPEVLSKIVMFLCSVCRQHDKSAVVKESMQALTDRQAAHKEHLLREELYSAKRDILVKVEQLEALASIGINIASAKAEAEERREDAMEEFAYLKSSIKTLENIVESLKAEKVKLFENLDKVTRGYRAKNLELLKQRQQFEQVLDKATAANKEATATTTLLSQCLGSYHPHP
eukprot:gene5927-9079_t